MTTHHIQATRQAWLLHCIKCDPCHQAAFSDGVTFCETGKAAFDEYRQAIQIHPSCESLTAMDTQEATSDTI